MGKSEKTKFYVYLGKRATVNTISYAMNSEYTPLAPQIPNSISAGSGVRRQSFMYLHI